MPEAQPWSDPRLEALPAHDGTLHVSQHHQPSGRRIVQQVEYYLSRHNLPTDTYLQSNMDRDLWIPLQLLLDFPRMRTLGATDASRVAHLLSARARGVEVDVSGSRIRPRPGPTLLILRAIPRDVPTASVVDFLGLAPLPPGIFYPKLLCFSAIEHYWAVIYESLVQANEAYDKFQGKQLNGVSLCCEVFVPGLHGPKNTTGPENMRDYQDYIQTVGGMLCAKPVSGTQDVISGTAQFNN